MQELMQDRKINVKLTREQYEDIKWCLQFMKVNGQRIHETELDASIWSRSVDRGLAALKLEEVDMYVEQALSHFHAPMTRVWAAPEGELGQLLQYAVDDGSVRLDWDSARETHVYTLTIAGIKYKFPEQSRNL